MECDAPVKDSDTSDSSNALSLRARARTIKDDNAVYMSAE